MTLIPTKQLPVKLPIFQGILMSNDRQSYDKYQHIIRFANHLVLMLFSTECWMNA